MMDIIDPRDSKAALPDAIRTRGGAPLPNECDPWSIARDKRLDTEAKIRRLRQLEYDVRQTMVASEEGMGGRSRLPTLADVLAAIAHVSPAAVSNTTPTKS